MKRQTDTQLFRQMVDQIGEKAIAKLSVEAKCGHSTIEQMYRGTYTASPSDSLRERICLSLYKLTKKKVGEDELFPFLGERENAS